MRSSPVSDSSGPFDGGRRATNYSHCLLPVSDERYWRENTLFVSGGSKIPKKRDRVTDLQAVGGKGLDKRSPVITKGQ